LSVILPNDTCPSDRCSSNIDMVWW
jgi:hypothetical protein